MATTTLLGSLFLSAFFSATLLPGTSEITLVGMIAAGNVSTIAAVAVATIGNTLGSCLNWGIGRFFAGFQSHRWFPVPSDRFGYYSEWFRRWGLWSLLLSWVPVIGDPLTVIAGIARTPLLIFISIVLVAKGARYMIVAGVLDLLS
ncbi:MAG: DedA family protein [Rhizobiales bacterium]|nr:DedA family protein [Hyphomicrobiales bacterium]